MALSSPISAEPRNGGYIQLEPMYMDVFGNDTHVANITRTQNLTVPPFTATNTAEGVDFEFDGDGAFRGELGYMRNQWGLGVNGLYFSPDGDLSQTVDLGTDNSVIVFGTAVAAVLAAPSPPGDNRATFNVDSEMSVWSTDFYGIRTLAEKPDSNIHILAGVKIGSIEHELGARGTQGIVTGGVFNATSTFTGRTSSDTDTLFGPLIGIEGDANWGKHRVNGLLMQSMVFSEADFENRLEADINLATPGLEAITSFSKNEDVGIPITELRIKYLYDVLDNLSLGIGGYASVWVDAPTAPGADLSTSAGGGGSINEQTLVFLGGGITAEFRF